MKIGNIISWNDGKCLGKVIQCVNEEYNDFVVELITPLKGTTTTWLGDDTTPYKVEWEEDDN